jgi:hypothetical protein
MHGGDQRLSDLRVSRLRSSDNGSLFPHQKLACREALSIGTAALLLMKAAIAIDPFNFSFVIKTGVIQSGVVAVLILLFMQASYAVLLRSWSVGEAYTIADIWRKTIHRETAWIPHCLVLYAYFSCLIADYWEILDGVACVVGWLWPNAPMLFLDSAFLQYVTMVLVAMSLLCTTQMRSYVRVSLLGLVCGVIAFVCAVVYFSRHMFDEDGYVATNEIVLFKPDFVSIYTCIREITAALFAHPYLPFIANEMHRPSRARVMKMTWIAMGPATLFVYVTPVVGYLLMTDVEDDYNFFIELDPAGSPEVVIGEVGVIVLSITSLLFFTFFIAHSFVTFFNGEQLGSTEEGQDSPTVRMLSALAVSLLAISVNFTTDLVEYLIYEIAMIVYCLIAFVLPGLYYLVQFRFAIFRWGVAACLILCLGTGLVVLSMVDIVDEMGSADLT